MEYNRLGRSGLQVSELSFGSWLTFSKDTGLQTIKQCMRTAFDAGVNFFDNAEVYAEGEAENLMGQALKDYRREDVVVSTKIFWGGKGPNDTGLSRKHVLEGTHNALRRLQLDYVDLLFCHRPDPDTPIEETVRAMDQLVRAGCAFYWGTSEWPAEAISEAHRLALELGCVPPSMEQPQYNLFHRRRVEVEYAPLFEQFGLGTTIWSPLASGILTGKYAEGIPKGSRLDKTEWLRKGLTQERLAAVSELAQVARDLGCSLAQLSLAWCLKNENVSTVITGATTPEQVRENMQALEVKARLDEGAMARLRGIIEKVPEQPAG